MAAEMETSTGGAISQEPLSDGTETKGPHKLERKWTFWFDNQSKPKQGAAWGSSLRNIYTFDTVEEFWSLYDQVFKPSKLQANADFHLFKTGIEPKWEDPECANGGKWSVTVNRKPQLDTMWLETLMALIGEQFEEGEEICGVVASVRQRQDKLALWTKTASNEAVQTSIGRKWKEIMDHNDKIVYSFHLYNLKILSEIALLASILYQSDLVIVHSRPHRREVTDLSVADQLKDDARREKSSRGGRYNV